MSKGFDLSSIGNLMQQAREMQERLSSLQAEVGARTIEASAGGGMVTARVNGKLEVLSIAIDPQVLEGGDREMLQDLVVAAVNQAIRQAQAMMADEMSKLTGGLKIPGLS
ncbi:MAG TPA: YbaB/EbfC family nucleoid-associated protein [Candidatus Binatia bacterium]|nr:YbaB/EbfC family nucleoid-associated protein [Candidatus Binatia bacterium]